MLPPTTRYTKSGDVNIAYQVVGDGPVDLVYAMGWVSNLDATWEEPSYARFLSRLASFSRLILFDKRGTGLSDRVRIDELPTMEQRMDDVRAVMDAAGSPSAALMGISEGGPICLLMAATYPERVRAVVTIGSYARGTRDGGLIGARTPEKRAAMLASVEKDWGGDYAAETLRERAPSVYHDERFRAWWGRYLRSSASPAAALALTRMNMQIDIRSALPAISAPVLVVHAARDQAIAPDNGQYLAGAIRGAKHLEIDSDDHLPWVTDRDADAIVEAVEEFITGKHTITDHDRVLATVLFTDIVDSTPQLVREGDRSWGDTIAGLERASALEVERHRGRLVKTTGDGILATFDGPARAIRCAQALIAHNAALGIGLRAGLHTGEIELRGNEIAGIAVHMAARVSAMADAGQVLVSSTVKDLVAGSGLEFTERGMHALKGVPGEWALYEVARG